jgi:uncharacterized protein (TIGR00251 family)
VIQLETHRAGVVLPVRAQPGAKRDEIRGEQDGELKVAVTQAPEKGKANKAIIELLARRLRLRKSQVELLAGANGNHKRFLILGVTLQDLQASIAKLTG